jgi:hypothetical protein
MTGNSSHSILNWAAEPFYFGWIGLAEFGQMAGRNLLRMAVMAAELGLFSL